MDEQVAVAGTQNKAAAELQGILTELVLAMAGGSCPAARHGVLAAQKVQQGGHAQFRGAVGLALLVHQKREAYAGLFAKNARVMGVAKPDGGHLGASGPEVMLALAQLRYLLAAEDSPVMTEEDNHRRRVGPQRAEAHEAAIGVGQLDRREPRAQTAVWAHGA
jgi:hypothetical protein